MVTDDPASSSKKNGPMFFSHKFQAEQSRVGCGEVIRELIEIKPSIYSP